MKELTVEWIHVQDKELVIDEIMDRYGQEILQLAYSYVNSVAVAEDLTQEILLNATKIFTSTAVDPVSDVVMANRN